MLQLARSRFWPGARGRRWDVRDPSPDDDPEGLQATADARDEITAALEAHQARQETDAKLEGWTGEIPTSLLRAFLVNHFEVADEGPFGPALDLGTEFNIADVLNRLNTLPESAMPEVFVRWMLHDSEDYHLSPWTRAAQPDRAAHAKKSTAPPAAHKVG